MPAEAAKARRAPSPGEPVTARRQRCSHLETVVKDVGVQIRSGALAPGERLASFQELGERYGVSQGLIAKAMAVLVKSGQVETRPRRGCFVANAPSPEPDRTGLGESRGTAAAAAAAPPTSQLSYLRPRTTPVQHLTLYVSQLQPSQLALWDQVLADFRESHPGLEITRLCCLDGHVEELAARHKIDLIETTPANLQPLRLRYTSPPELGMIGVDAAAFLPLVRERMAAGEPLPGVPFGLTLHYLFANATLLSEAGVSAGAPAGLEELVTRAIDTNRRLPADASAGRQGLITAGLCDYLILAGALQCEQGKLLYRPERARAVLSLFAGSRLASDYCVDMPVRFAAGGLAFMHHCSYEVVALREEVRFDWRLMPLPVGPGARVNAHLTVLALNRDTACPQEVLALMQYLCSEPVQLAFAREFGNVPVLTRAALAPEVVAGHPAGAEGYRKTLEHSSLLWPERVIRALPSCCGLDSNLNPGRLTPDAALARLGYALELTFGNDLLISRT